MTTYYAVCNVNGPISVRLDGETREEALACFAAAADDGRAWIDEPRMDAEDDLDIDGADMSEEEFDEALKVAGAQPIDTLSPIDGRDRTYHLSGGWFLWCVGDE